jgi:voltage-gated potassium channel
VDKNANTVSVYELFMLVLCAYVLIALAAMTFCRLDEDVQRILEYVDIGVCMVFLADFCVQLATAKSKLGYLKWGWIDLLSSVPMVGPLRWGRLARVVRTLRLLRGLKSARMISTYLAKRRSDSAIAAVALVALLTIVFASIAVLHFERDFRSANIVTAEDALWWAVATITTVGYGDRFPVSTGGRFVAAIAMTVGVGLFGTFTAFVATWFIEPGEQEQDDELELIRRQLAAMEAKLDQLVRRDR